MTIESITACASGTVATGPKGLKDWINQCHPGDCMEVMRGMPDNCVDSIVTDPPYGLSFMGKKWDYDVPAVEVWAECLRVLKPGGHLLAFAGTRTQHRMACRIEDAGFEIRDTIAWVYGSGFPKSLDVSKAIDKAAGAEREVVGTRTKRGIGGSQTFAQDAWTQANRGEIELDITTPATEAAQKWQGWGTALKPALEPITMARKPFACTVAANVLRHGTGALNIDACRVGADGGSQIPGGMDRLNEANFRQGYRPSPYGRDGEASADRRYTNEGGTNFAATPGPRGGDPMGRWPANLIHDGSDEVVALFPQSAGQQGDVHGTEPSGVTNGIYGDFAGSAARFFYCAKAGTDDRNDGLSHFVKRDSGCYAQDEWSKKNMQTHVLKQNHHPTVKPTDLMRYLCRLVTPPGGIVLDPFMGSGSTGCAAVLEGFQFVGIEREAEYVEIAQARIASAVAQGFQPSFEFAA